MSDLYPITRQYSSLGSVSSFTRNNLKRIHELPDCRSVVVFIYTFFSDILKPVERQNRWSSSCLKITQLLHKQWICLQNGLYLQVGKKENTLWLDMNCVKTVQTIILSLLSPSSSCIPDVKWSVQTWAGKHCLAYELSSIFCSFSGLQVLFQGFPFTSLHCQIIY